MVKDYLKSFMLMGAAFGLIIALLSPLVRGMGRAEALSGRINFAPDTLSLTEGSSQAVSIQLDSPITASLSDVASLDISLASSDPARVTVSPGTLHFDATDWSQPKSVTISSIDDAIYNNGGTATISLSATSNAQYYSGYATSLPVTVVDNDPVPAVASGLNPGPDIGETSQPDDRQTTGPHVLSDSKSVPAPKKAPAAYLPSGQPASLPKATEYTRDTTLAMSPRRASDTVAVASVSILASLIGALLVMLWMPKRRKHWQALASWLKQSWFNFRSNALKLLRRMHGNPRAVPMLAAASVGTLVAVEPPSEVDDKTASDVEDKPEPAKAKKPRKTTKKSTKKAAAKPKTTAKKKPAKAKQTAKDKIEK